MSEMNKQEQWHDEANQAWQDKTIIGDHYQNFYAGFIAGRKKGDEQIDSKMDYVFDLEDRNRTLQQIWKDKEKEIAQLKEALKQETEALEGVFEKIKHGDEEHQKWLKNKMDEIIRSVQAQRKVL